MDDPKYGVKFFRWQFPIRICFAMTINKAEGQSLGTVGIYLPRPVFAHGQLYVALTRGESVHKIFVFIVEIEGVQGFDEESGQYYTKNVVYQEVFKSDLTRSNYKKSDPYNIYDCSDDEVPYIGDDENFAIPINNNFDDAPIIIDEIPMVEINPRTGRKKSLKDEMSDSDDTQYSE